MTKYTPLNYRRASNQKSNVTIVISIYHRGERLFKLVDSLLSQAVQNFDVIALVEDQDSLDFDDIILTLKPLNNLGVQVVSQADRIEEKWQSIFKSSSHFICFIDTRFVVDPTYIDKCVWFLDANSQFSFCNTWTYSKEPAVNTLIEDGEKYLEVAATHGQCIVVRLPVVGNAQVTLPEVNIISVMQWLAKKGRWGGTLPEYLCWHDISEVRGQILKLDITNELKNMPLHEPAERQPYATLREDFPIENLLLTDTKPRILFVLPWMVVGGADKFNLDLLEMLNTRGYQVTICTTLQAEHSWEGKFKEITPDVFVLRRFLDPSDFPRFMTYLIQSRSIEVVLISGSQMGYQFLPYMRAHSPSVAFIDLSHVEEPHWNNGGHPRFAIGYQDMLDLNIVSTKHLASWMTGRGADEERIRVLYTGVDEYSEKDTLCTRLAVRNELGLTNDIPIIIFAGRLCQQKRPIMLARILRGVYEKGLRFHAFVVGDGDQKIEFESIIGNCGLHDDVTMFGSIEHKQWLGLLQASDIFLLPSEYEGISIALLEAMSVGIVPVVSEVGGQKEIVQDKAGYIIPRGDDEEERYSEVLETLLVDATLRGKLAKESRSLIDKYFSKKVTIANFEKVLAEAKDLSVNSPRVTMPVKFAKELATSAIEMNRLESAVHYLWGQGKELNQANSDFSIVLTFILSIRESKIGIFLSKNNFFRKVLLFIVQRIKKN